MGTVGTSGWARRDPRNPWADREDFFAANSAPPAARNGLLPIRPNAQFFQRCIQSSSRPRAFTGSGVNAAKMRAY